MKEQRESIPSIEAPLEAKVHEGEASRKETQTLCAGPVEPREE